MPETHPPCGVGSGPARSGKHETPRAETRGARNIRITEMYDHEREGEEPPRRNITYLMEAGQGYHLSPTRRQTNIVE